MGRIGMDKGKLYYQDSHIKNFAARVLSCAETTKGYEIVLDQTAFYPEGGGQACDLGTLDEAVVLHVKEQDETVVHICDCPLEVGKTVEGAIDWNRRFDLMQQHSGEHMVSGVIHRMFGWHNVGFHMGSDMVTIDFDGPIPQEALTQIEQAVNEKIWQNLPVTCGYPSEEELPSIPYRTKRQLPWPVRIVEIPGVDICACCGTHVKNTGEVGLVKLFSCVKFHQGVRIEMACGARAAALLSKTYEQNRLVSQAFSAKIMETGEAAKKINEALAAEKYRVASLQKRLFGFVAESYRDQGNVVHFETELSPAGIRELAEIISGVCGGIAAVLSGCDGRYDVCLACPGGDVKELGSRMAKELDGRGGGKPGFFQGSVKASKADILDFFQDFGR